MTQEAREHLFLVLFFDNKRTWSVLWVLLTHLCVFTYLIVTNHCYYFVSSFFVLTDSVFFPQVMMTCTIKHQQNRPLMLVDVCTQVPLW